MAATYLINPDRSLVLLPSVSPLGWQQWVDMMTAVLADPDFRPGIGFLSDRRRLPTPFAPPVLERVIQFFSAHRAQLAGSPWAVVTSPGPIHNATSVMAALSEPSGIRIRPFTDVEAGMDWVVPQAPTTERRAYVEWLEANAVR